MCANMHGYGYIVTLVECSSEILTIIDFTYVLPKVFTLNFCTVVPFCFLELNFQILTHKTQAYSNNNLVIYSFKRSQTEPYISAITLCHDDVNVCVHASLCNIFDGNQTLFYICTFFLLTVILFVLKCEAAYLLT